MARGCKVCKSGVRTEVEAALLNGVSTHKVGKQFGFTQACVQRHKVNCRVAALTKELNQRIEKVDVMVNLVLLLDRAAKTEQEAASEGKHGAVAALIGRQKEILDSIHEIQGPDEQTRDFTRDPRWIEAWNRVLSALTTHPEARIAVMRALAAPTPGGDSGNPE